MQPKCIAIIGAGGKTTALRTLAHAFAAQRVLVTTSTHIFPLTPPDCRISLIDPTPDTLLAQLRLPGAVCAGQQANDSPLSCLHRPRTRLTLYYAKRTACTIYRLNCTGQTSRCCRRKPTFA